MLLKLTSLAKVQGILCVAMLLISMSLYGQNSDHYGGGLKMNLSPEGDRYVRFLLWNQIWMRSTQNNPGTLIGGESADQSFDIGARRLRLIAYAQITPRYMILTHLGINNQTFINGGATGTSGTGGAGAGKKPQLFFHDAYNEYAIIPSKNLNTGKNNAFTMSMGAGLHYWNGISRMTSSTTISTLMLDAPIFNWPTIENADQFARQFGIYLKGYYDRLHYQVALNKPFSTSQTPPEGSINISVDNSGNTNPSYAGYFDYQFLEQESNLLPYRVGSYLGSKKVLNIGAGFYTQANGTKSLDAEDMLHPHAIKLFGTDVFLDMPLGAKSKNMALTLYGVYYHYDFGPNYIRTLGIMNTGTLDPNVLANNRVLEGAGNSRILLGTGNIYYLQSGYMLPKFSDHDKLRLQPYAAITHQNLEALNQPGNYWDVGFNFFIDAHNAKISAQYSSRPLYDVEQKTRKDRKGEFIIQFQVAI